ncbi:hypothetical protein VPH35_052018 [Triticum aestivum]
MAVEKQRNTFFLSASLNFLGRSDSTHQAYRTKFSWKVKQDCWNSSCFLRTASIRCVHDHVCSYVCVCALACSAGRGMHILIIPLQYRLGCKHRADKNVVVNSVIFCRGRFQMLIFSVLPKELGEQMHSPNDIQENIFKRRNKIWLAILSLFVVFVLNRYAHN